MRTLGGEKMARRLEVRVFGPGNATSDCISLKAPRGRGFADKDVTTRLDHLAIQLEEKYPGREFRLVEMGSGRFNFVWVSG